MPYQAERDATIPKVIGTTRNAEGERVAHYESVTYSAGAVIFEEEIAPHVLRRLEEGDDDHISSLLRYVDEAEARQILGQQAQDSAPQSTDEGEILHQEERLGSSPSVEPEAEVGDEPPYEAPPAGVSSDGDQVVTEDQTVGQGTGGTEEDASKAEEEPQGTSESDGESTEEASAETSDGDGEQETESEASGDGETSDDGQQDGQDQSDDSQEESEGDAESTEPQGEEESTSEDDASDEFTEMSKADLLKAAKAKKISGRTKMTEDQLREALRAG